jgi:hypothetical protein
LSKESVFVEGEGVCERERALVKGRGCLSMGRAFVKGEVFVRGDLMWGGTPFSANNRPFLWQPLSLYNNPFLFVIPSEGEGSAVLLPSRFAQI